MGNFTRERNELLILFYHFIAVLWVEIKALHMQVLHKSSSTESDLLPRVCRMCMCAHTGGGLVSIDVMLLNYRPSLFHLVHWGRLSRSDSEHTDTVSLLWGPCLCPLSLESPSTDAGSGDLNSNSHCFASALSLTIFPVSFPDRIIFYFILRHGLDKLPRLTLNYYLPA